MNAGEECALPRVLHTVASLEERFGGPVRSVTYLCTALSDFGHSTKLLSQSLVGSSGPIVRPNSPSVELKLVRAWHSDRFRIIWSPHFARGLEALIETFNPRILHDHGVWLPSNHSVANAARRARLPLVNSPRGSLGAWSLKQKSMKKRIALALYQRRDLNSVACFFATSSIEAEQLRDVGIRQPIAVIPNGIPIPLEEMVSASRSRNRIALFLSRLHPKKGVLELVRAWARVRPHGWILKICGPSEGDYFRVVQRLIAREGAEDAIELTSGIADGDKGDLYRSASLFILPSHFENFGLVVAEALSYKVPVITTLGTPWSELNDSACGWHIPLNELELASAISDATSRDEPTLRLMGERGRELVCRRYSWQAVAKQTSTTYGWLVAGAPRPSWVI